MTMDPRASQMGRNVPRTSENMHVMKPQTIQNRKFPRLKMGWMSAKRGQKTMRVRPIRIVAAQMNFRPLRSSSIAETLAAATLVLLLSASVIAWPNSVHSKVFREAGRTRRSITVIPTSRMMEPPIAVKLPVDGSKAP